MNKQITAQATALAPVRVYPNFLQLVDDALRVQVCFEGISKAWDYDHVEDMDEAIKNYSHFVALALKVENGIKEFDEGSIDANGVVTPNAAKKMIAVLVGSFPASKIAEPEIFVRSMRDHVIAANPSPVELFSAVQRLIATKKFSPVISEVLDAIYNQKEFWSEVVSGGEAERAYCELIAERDELARRQSYGG